MKRVAVIGAGIVGLSAARELRARGHDVLVVERESQEREGASHGNAGIVVPSHFVPLAAPGIVWQGIKWMADPSSPFHVRPRLDPELVAWGLRFLAAANARHVRRAAPSLLALNLAGRALYAELSEELGRERIGYQERGLWMLCASEQGLEEEAKVAEHARSLGLRAEVMSAHAVQEREPEIALGIAGAVHFPDDAHMDPGAVLRALQEDLRNDTHAELRFDTHTAELLTRNGAVDGVALRPAGRPQGPVTVEPVDAVVLAAGAWSAPLARTLGTRLMLQPGKGYALTITQPSQRLRAAAILVEARASASTVGAAFRIGGTMELAGFDEGTNETRIEGIRRSARRYFPELPEAELAGAVRWSGMRPVSPDGLPYLGVAPGARNAVIATGHAMFGFSTGPISGRIAAQLLSGEAPELNLSAFAPDRHAGWFGTERRATP